MAARAGEAIRQARSRRRPVGDPVTVEVPLVADDRAVRVVGGRRVEHRVGSQHGNRGGDGDRRHRAAVAHGHDGVVLRGRAARIRRAHVDDVLAHAPEHGGGGAAEAVVEVAVVVQVPGDLRDLIAVGVEHRGRVRHGHAGVHLAVIDRHGGRVAADDHVAGGGRGRPVGRGHAQGDGHGPRRRVGGGPREGLVLVVLEAAVAVEVPCVAHDRAVGIAGRRRIEGDGVTSQR